VERKTLAVYGKVDDYDSDVNSAELPAPHARVLRKANPDEICGIVDGADLYNPLNDRMPKGMAVEGRFEAGDEWFPGVISKVNAGATYDINYDDGDVEKSVPALLVRALYSARRARGSHWCVAGLGVGGVDFSDRRRLGIGEWS